MAYSQLICRIFWRENDSYSFQPTQRFTNLSQCRTLVHNTVVRATFKVNGKPPILGSRSPLTPWRIDLKFDTGDYVGDMTPHAKNGKNRPRRADPAKGWNVKVKCGLFLFLFLLYNFLPASGDHIFASIDTVFAQDNVFRWGLIS